MIYLLHVEGGNPRRRHYLGYTAPENFPRRMRDHASGNGAVTTRKMLLEGGTLYLARVYPDETTDDERRRKNNGQFSRLCPICRTGRLPMPIQGWSIKNPAELDPAEFISFPSPHRKRRNAS